ncbi:hypothetical protein D8674_026402 [Pyrus ussuriensis x Pyrus communis]|uniref:Uncharacterized protein n=1 Tax=Pyrus ussuriensis x Pyrus communis TaxID=2448454 RepID=A0A5N5I7U6_9ROSA|nr:hypothetical protein D8674_026402 [Pyrus ussuriensis x Pyrus communis]
MIATFLLTVGQNSRYCQTRDAFRRSHFTTSKKFQHRFESLEHNCTRCDGQTHGLVQDCTTFFTRSVILMNFQLNKRTMNLKMKKMMMNQVIKP